MATPNTLRGLATLTFYATDLAAARDWYAQFLGTEAYFAFPKTGNPAYVEFRIGDYQHELGIIDAQYAPRPLGEAGGPIAYWHVDDIEAVYTRLLSLGATEFEPITQRANSNFVTASVIDPFGNLLGIMYNPHYLEIVSAIQ
ncbi:VOC family protein [uncultured Chitinophaga sp.]|uniref:VOC family protein n=1 Tax=uncultured Chitinophaga sp. TaxID=339340 RepID=UPI0025ED1310|nr:VOC family protein [uncultured Chitinophaga sp.]